MPFLSVTTQILPSINNELSKEDKDKLIKEKLENIKNKNNFKNIKLNIEDDNETILIPTTINTPIYEKPSIKEKIENLDNKKNLLIAGHEFKFADDMINFLKQKYNIKLDKWINHKDHNQQKSLKLIKWADIILCEWCLGNAIFYSKNKLKNKKLFIRLHRIEITTNYIFKVEWNNVDKLIVVGPHIYERTIKIIPEMKNKTVIIYNDINLYPSLDTKDNVKYNLGVLGYLPMLKRLDLVIDLLFNLVKYDKNYKLFIKGKKPEDLDWLIKKTTEKEYYNNINKKIKEYNLEDNIIYEEHTINKKELNEWFNKISYMISCSDVESFHKSIAEGMTNGCIPIIFGGFYKKGGANLIYPNEFCCEDINDAMNKIIELNNNDNILNEKRNICKKFIETNFSKELVYDNIINLLETNNIKYKISKYNYGITNKNKIVGIYTDINLNVLDGSTIWLINILNMLLINNFEQPTIYCILKHNIDRNIINSNIICINKVFFIEPKDYLDIGLNDVLIDFNNLFSPTTIIIRGTTETINNIPNSILNKTIIYPLSNFDKISDKLKNCKYIACQTDSIKNLLINYNKCLSFYPMINNISFDNSSIKNNNKIKIVYTGTIRDEYDSYNMLKEIEKIDDENIEIQIVISKIYYKEKQEEVEQYINKLKNTKIKILNKLSQKEINNIYKQSHIGIHWRKPTFDTLELSTKLLEFIYHDLIIIGNNNSINKEILGDYPYLINNINEITNIIYKAIHDIKNNNKYTISYDITKHYISNINNNLLNNILN